MNINRNHIYRNLYTFFIVFALVTLPALLVHADGGKGTDTSKIVIVHTNDAHCSINRTDDSSSDTYTLGYACLAGVARQKEAIYKNVTIADAGDHIQGESVGVLTKGQAIIRLMNTVGYDVSTLGNHEFDYGLDTLFSLTKSADYPYVSCNFKNLQSGESVYDPYIIKNYDIDEDDSHDIQIAYVGVTTPETITRSAEDIFRDAQGNLLYSFCQDKTGEALYNCVQASVDSARAEGADYVVLVGHLGQIGVTPAWRSDTIVENTTGIDAVIDGHSHEKYIQQVKNKDGKNVLIAQTGAKLNSVGVMTLDVATGTFSEEIIDAPYTYADENVQAVTNEINESLEEILNEPIGTSNANLYATESDNCTWIVRTNETNLGDLITDAFKTVLKTDVAIIGGGSIRKNINEGQITYQNLLDVLPWGNDTCVIKATGQQILDALEMGAYKYSQFSGAFMQVSGITYDINTSVTPSHVVVDDNQYFVKVDGRYRVENVKINGQPIDLSKTYTVAGCTFTLLKQGDGLTMFDDCEVVVSTGPKDIEVLRTYLSDTLQNVIGTGYENKYGQGRIRFVKDEEKSTTEDTTATKPATTSTNKILILKGKAKKKSITLKWNSVNGASYYKVYFSRCGKRWNHPVTTKKLSMVKKKLKKGKGYRCYVVAYSSKNKILVKSPAIYMATRKGKYANATKVKLNKSSISLNIGKNSSIKGKISKKDAKKKLFGKKYVSRTIRYYSTNKTVATVNGSGKITAKKSGTCYVYAVAPSGVWDKVKVVVR